ncbi:MAG: hypothetical protein AAF211_11355 [Myxococcota bacterium]
MGRRILGVFLVWGALVGFANGFASLAGFGGGPCQAQRHHHHHATPAAPVDAPAEAR